MKFIISKADCYCGCPPCVGVAEEAYKHIDRRTCKDFDEIRAHGWGAKWMAEGSNHRIENGMVARDLDTAHRAYTMDVDWPLLMALADKHGTVTINKTADDGRRALAEYELVLG